MCPDVTVSALRQQKQSAFHCLNTKLDNPLEAMSEISTRMPSYGRREESSVFTLLDSVT